MMHRAVLFDLDGTLLDSLKDIGDSMNIVLLEEGFTEHVLSDYGAFVGDGVRALVERALPPEHRGPETVERCLSRMRKVYGARSDHHTRPYDGIPELLDELVRRGVALAVLSNKPHALTVPLVAKLLGRWEFHPVLGERAGVRRKPDPAGALEVAAVLGLSPAEILYVGDTPTDMETARRAGMHPVGVAWGFRSELQLREAGAASVATRPRDLLSGWAGSGARIA